VPTNFDPYHAWLRIPKGSRPLNHYQLLGLPPFTSEPPVIAEAAESQFAKLKPYLTGEHAASAQLVMKEIAQSKAVLLNAAARRSYDAELRKQMNLPPAADPQKPAAAVSQLPPQAAPARPVAAVATPVQAAPAQAAAVHAMPAQAVPVQAMPVQAMPVQAMPMQAAPMMATAVPTAAAPAAAFAQQLAGAPLGELPTTSASAYKTRAALRRRQQRRSSSTQVVMGLLGLSVVVLGGAIAWANRDTLMAKLSPPAQPLAPAVPAAPAGPDLSRLNGPGAEDRLARKYKQYEEQPGAIRPRQRNSSATDEAFGKVASVMNDNPSMDDAPAKPAKEKKAPPKQTKKPPVASGPLTKAKPEEAAAVAKTLASARIAMGDRNLKKADEQLDLATLESASGESLAAVGRMRNLLGKVRGFWNAVHEASGALKAADELVVDGQTVIVVESSKEKLTVRAEGGNRNYTVEKMPAALAKVLAERVLKLDNADSKVLLGAFQAVDPKGDRALARQLWQQATDSGANIAGLIADLDALPK
jgi:hypothetical protein